MADDFDMPSGAGATFEDRGGWVANALVADLGLNLIQACGIVGNIGFESGAFKHLQEIGVSSYERGGYGWAQWTGPRRRAYEAWCEQEQLDPASDEANYGYLYVELTGSYAHVVKALRQETTLDRCVFVFGRLYEAPGGTTETYLPGFDERTRYAQRALLGARAAPPTVVADAAPDNGGVLGWIKSKLFGA